ncbi:MAG: 3D domain-containing protein [Blastocatellia bacterium]
MYWFPGRSLIKGIYSGLFVLAVVIVINSLSKPDTVLAADDPEGNASKSSQLNSIDIPGSFKDLPDARDVITAKRGPEQIGSLSTREPSSLDIDVQKVPSTADFHPENQMIDFDATAYCLKGRTASGVNTAPGMIAADPRVLPLGTLVHLRAGSYTGTYKVTDTGGRIKGRRVDVYVPTHREAIQFGRKRVKIKILGRGSNKTDRATKNLMASEF